MIYLPNWMYELLPYGYLSLGSMAAVAVDPTWGRLSGLLLLAVAGYVIKLRADYRREALINI